MTEHNAAKGKIIGAIVVVVIVAIAAWWYFTRMPGVDFSRQGPAPSAPAPASTAPPPIEHPIEMAQTGPASASTAPLPTLDASDDLAAASLAKLPGADGLAGLLVAKGLIPHIVATVDALPRHTIGSSILPLQTPKGTFVADAAGTQPMIGAQNYARYAPFMQIVEGVDARTMVTWYVHWYPLFQQAYRQLGYPHGYFNDRLIAAIDDMLAAPNAGASVALVKADNGLYKFADPTWEALSVGQKLMIRVGPENERTLKLKLHRIRALLMGNAVILGGHAPAPSGS
ncbi:MAG TPA: DUF3014 domain-containing protein [Rhodanobacteraceae bacterium]|nr:DUF3014 domain-containing protein [Rhodanobacteraceae bacterium]